MKRKKPNGQYEYPEWITQIISEKLVKLRIRAYDLVGFEDDILQEFILRLSKAKKRRKDINVYFAYEVLRSVLNNLHNMLGRDHNKKTKFRDLKITEGGTSIEKGPLELIIDKDEHDQLNLLLDRLDREDQIVLELRYYYDYTFKQIAKVFGYKGENGARVRHNRIIKRLKVSWDEKNK